MGPWPETRAHGPYPSLWACECTALLQTPFSHGNDPPASFLSMGLAPQHPTLSRELAGTGARVQLPAHQESTTSSANSRTQR